MSPLSQADIDRFFSTSSPRSRPRPRPRPPRASRSSPPPVSIVVHDSDDDIVALPSEPNALPRPARPSFPNKFPSLASDESAENSDSDIRAVRLSPKRKAWRATTRRVVSDDDDEDTLPISGKRKAASSSESESEAGLRNGVKNRHPRARDPGSGRSGDEEPWPSRRLTRAQRRRRDSDSGSPSERPARRRRRSSAKHTRLDPDEESNEAATEEESADEIELDEPERFVTATRLRTRGETAQQRMLRKLKNRRLNLPSSDDEEEESEGPSGAWEYVRDDDDGFISEDDGFDERLMPSEFSLGYAQSQEYKFKVMFQYLLLLVIHGPDVLPLRGAQKEYMAPVGELRSYIRGIRNLRVRSQIWRPEFVKALETYPKFLVSSRAEIARYCHACNRRNQHCWQSVYLTGTQYDPESHDEVEGHTGNEGDDDDDDDDEDGDGEKLPRNFDMGPHCLDSARLYHALSHWEHHLFRRIRGLYRELLRAKGVDVDDNDDSDSDGDVDDAELFTSVAERVAELRRTQLPDEHDVNAVLEWMEGREYQTKAFEHFTGLEQKARMLGGDDMLRETGPDHY
ncbi:uncharacterized protein CcaverHIS019_0408130 [Cutaneotrichosporon cavernicola]|uniref:DUF4211 domain-containing protein n=1 Tax=Cutaneotrichosporon cavernicola TaxID=279322 RepID=A0AA48L4X1_9TREE|nr:uncharacterized protein CcaverHIS019_0408130 [Cutaneotrichosporon cavernicola]BEI91993.1 hypothetical protein CcaverHIS019_0408130 [Cutaneotrichosporon cavernicola]BEI99764.1 hypothetical protein CcaverHIS631_0408070 [Cutaneotrichosporon cavernicola]BEJ07540.1 hypothetical protein CcaverHIS641_0408090 [Cutaneotrichosporon cavernicola]